MKFYPSPGIVVLEPLTDTSPNWGDKKDTKIKQGKVIAVGPNLITDFNALLEMKNYAKVGDIVTFLQYEGAYDESYIDSKDYRWVKIQDLRGVINAK